MPDYVIQPGDNPWALAEKLYGDGRWAIEILRQNAGASWVGGTVISIPDQGSVKELQDSGFKPLITNAQASYLATGMQNFGTTPFDKFGNPTGSVPASKCPLCIMSASRPNAASIFACLPFILPMFSPNILKIT